MLKMLVLYFRFIKKSTSFFYSTQKVDVRRVDQFLSFSFLTIFMFSRHNRKSGSFDGHRPNHQRKYLLDTHRRSLFPVQQQGKW